MKTTATFSKKCFWGIVIFYFATLPLWADFRGQKSPFIYDVEQYYSYLPALIVHGDLSFSYQNGYWLHDAGNGKMVQKYTLGLSILYLPLFLIGHFFAWILGDAMDGYSYPYIYALCFGTLLYFALGLYYLRKILLQYFDDFVCGITILSLALATNLLYYTVGTGQMPHVYLFTLYSVFIYAVMQWHKTFQWKHMTIAGIAFGLATLIRPSEAILLVIPLFFGITNATQMKDRLFLFLKEYKQLLFFGLIAFLIISIQFVYWKIYGGSWIIYTYGNEGFNFGDPQILNVLFSYRKGLFIYTPIILFAFVGIFFLKKDTKNFILPLIIFLIIYLYVISSWWNWWYGGGFGMRALVQTYALLAIPLAAFYQFVYSRFQMKKLMYVLLIPFILLNFLQTFQYKKTVIHWENMTKEAYWIIFGKLRLDKEEWKRLNDAYRAPELTPEKEE